ncbi:MAG: hypothetical protein LBT94_07380 [Prevotellaceae bacterium]|nr:hypothetical protein [Prevotellaceae bacterium]
MKNKLRKYIWIIVCLGVAAFHVSLSVAGGMHNTGASITNLAYILIFATAIIRELNFSRVLSDVMLALSILALVYGMFFAPSFF